MPNLFARQTALTNVGGRIDYISNPERQENLLAVHDGAADLLEGKYWRQLARECKAASKYAAPGTKSIQGREQIIQLSNALLDRMSPEEIAATLAKSFEEKYDRPAIVAVHYNKSKSNLHAHLIYAERSLLQEQEVKVAPRALFFDEMGKRHYKKSEILDGAGELRPGCRIVKKGEIYESRCFGAVDPRFSRPEWLRQAKSEWLLPLRNGELKGDVEIHEYQRKSGKLAQQHVGKGNPADLQVRVEEYNQAVREYNQLSDRAHVPDEVMQKIQKQVTASMEKNQILQNAIDRLKLAIMAAQKDMQDKQKTKQKEKEEKAKKVLDDYDRKRKKTLDDQVGYANVRMNWRMQEKIDNAQGTDYAKQNKANYWKNHPKNQGR